jgi:hypothetical protein
MEAGTRCPVNIIEKEPITHHADPRQLSGVQLALLGVELMNRYDLLLRCVTCGQTWTPELDSHGKLIRGYWVCPSRCNA